MERELKSLYLPENLAGERIDLALSRVTGLSRNVISNLMENSEVRLVKSNQPLLKSYKVLGGELIEILLPKPTTTDRIIPTPYLDSAGEAALPIVFQDSDLVVVDKPVGMAAHASVSWKGPTVIGALVAMGINIETGGIAERQGIVHRLDVGTSGLMMVAKSERAYSNLKDQFRNRNVKKIYWALVQGQMDPSEGTIDAPIDRHPKADYKFAVISSGKKSISHYKSLEFFSGMTLVEVELETGRTHQIRVHFSALSHPLIGDNIYGADPVVSEKLGITRPWLHAHNLEFNHPVTGELLTFTSPLPSDLASSLATLRSR